MELLAARGVTKFFAETSTLANDGLSLSLREGEILAVVGENGAGKSTLARILAGFLRPDSGEVAVRGKPLVFRDVRDAERAGVGMVPQYSFLAGGLSVAENLVLGREPRRLGLFLDRRRAVVEAAQLAEEFGFRVDPDALVSSLPPAARRQADIMRALARGGDALILDEPSSLLTEAETEALFALVRGLARAGKGVMLITHRVSEVKSLADRVAVLREGRLAALVDSSGLEDCDLSGLMARASSCGFDPRERSAPPPGEPLMEARGLVLDGARDSSGIDFELRRGEVLGLVALAGNGLDRLEALASGLAKPLAGSLLLAGKPVHGYDRPLLRSSMLAYVPSERDARGLALGASLADNVLALERRRFRARDWLGRRAREARAAELAAGFALAAGPGRRVASLSGGNRQRLLLARELGPGGSGGGAGFPARPAALLCEPTQGLDVAAQEAAATRIRALARNGAAVLLLTADLDELLLLADRVGVLYRGRLVHLGPNEGESLLPLLLARMTGAEDAA